MPSSRFKVHVTKDYLVFCSGHFITYDGDHCERIHGHNYRTAVEVEGDLDLNHYVIDFIALKDMTRAITDELDHRMLLPCAAARSSCTKTGPTSGSPTATGTGAFRARNAFWCPLPTRRPSCWPTTSRAVSARR